MILILYKFSGIIIMPISVSTSAKYNTTMNLYVNNYITLLVCSEVGQVRPTRPIVS